MKKIVTLILYALPVFMFGQMEIPKKPAFQTSIYDYAKILSGEQKNRLERKLINYADSTSTQIVVVTIPQSKGEDIGLLTPRWAQQWGIGQKGKDNGVLMLLALDQRKIWIAPGYGLEHILTAGINGEIVRKYIIPEFKQGNYYAGLDAGTTKLMELFSGTYKGEGIQQQEIPLWLIALVIAGVIILFAMAGKKDGGSGKNRSRGGGGIDLSDIIILSSMGRSGGFGGFSGGGSGGFGGGFGGGGFSGGGAGGSW